MEIFLPLLWIGSGISLFAGLLFGLFGLLRRQEQVFLAFGGLSILLGIYMMFSAQWYQAESVGSIARIARIEMAIICLVYPTFVWFIGLYINNTLFPKFLLAVSGIFGALFIINLFSPYSFLYEEISFAEPIQFPWGESVNKYNTPIRPIAWFYYAATYSIFIWAVYRSVASWIKAHNTRALSIIIYLVIQMLVVIHAELIDNLNLQSVYLGEIAFLILVLMVGTTLVQEVRARSESLEKSVKELQEETARREEYEQQLRYMAHHDSLTDLPNRWALPNQLTALFNSEAGKNCCCAILLIDLDNFKLINNSLGHDLGDQLLLMIAERLKVIAADGCLPVRLGGDEFAILYGGLSCHTEEAQKAAVLKAQSICDEILKPYRIAEHELVISACIGIDIFNEESKALTEIMKHADMALYRAKSTGPGSIEVYAPSLKKEADRRLVIDKGMRDAIENGQIDVYFQPQVDTEDRVIGVEALARWRHPTLGDIAPDEFIPVSEETGLIHALGEIVLRKSCQYLKSWEGDGQLAPPRISVNVSPWQLETNGFVKIVKGVLADTDVDASRLNMEITESTFMREIKSISRKMDELSELGITFSIDDFGTGYSALAWLKKLPLHELKIDRMFVKDMAVTRHDRFVETILAIAKQMDLQAVAEGVETTPQRMALLAMGCQCFQGNLISVPLPEEKLLVWMQNYHATNGIAVHERT